MPNLRHIALLAFDGCQVLDATGPAAVFTAANDAAGKLHYQVHLLSAKGGMVMSGSGIRLVTESVAKLPAALVDTALVAGGSQDALRSLVRSRTVRAWLCEAASSARRFGSVCTGVFVLAHFGLIDGKRVTTHWRSASLLDKHFPRLQVDANALYVEDGRVWTSAGVSTGIDMSLALVARDLGVEIANAVARRLVLYAHRPGYQSQFSPLLAAQSAADPSFSGLIERIRQHLDEPLSVARLADWAAMSPRNFHRRFTDAVGETPARFIEIVRLDHARHLLGTRMSLKEIAAKSGYASQGQFAKAFSRRFGVSPGLFREIHGAAC